MDMLVPMPIGLWIFSFVCDHVRVGGSANPAWTTVALYCIGGGIVGALLAARPGLIDFLSLPARPAPPMAFRIRSADASETAERERRAHVRRGLRDRRRPG